MKNLDEIIERITADAEGDDGVFRAFLQTVKNHVKLPADGFIIGEPVSVTAIDYDGNERRGLTATCSREDGSLHLIPLAEVVFPKTLEGLWHITAYRKWLGLEPFPDQGLQRRPHKATADDLDLSKPVELVALSVKGQTARCRLPASDRVITLRASGVYDLVPGEIITVKPKKQWRYGGHPYLSGEIQSTRLDPKALGLVPLGLANIGIWDPQEHYWGEEDEPVEEWAKPIIARGSRPMFEMEQVLPGENEDDPFDDPISQAADLQEIGQLEEARKILMELCQADLRCLDAHAHLGNLTFDHRPKYAIRHYETGMAIGELSLGSEFRDVLLWGVVDNRPFLRCMRGYGLCLWRMGRFEEAEEIFVRMLWLNPSDNQGVRFLLDPMRARTDWEDHKNV